MTDREVLVRRGLMLNYLTIGYNTLEAAGALIAGSVAGGVALVGFGIDSVIEVSASIAAQWRLRADVDERRREQIERITLRIIGWCFLALGAYVLVDSATTLWRREHPGRSTVGVVILTLSVIVMPILARAKRRVARSLESRALEADAVPTSLCAYLSAIALAAFAYELSGRNATVVVGTALTLRILAFVLFAPAAGILADRIDRRRLLVGADLTRVALMGCFPSSRPCGRSTC
jgi:divalent metal cation (Fe/Co/Zn/Cd) transporter